MQTAVDRNGSSNTTTINTIISTTIETIDNDNTSIATIKQHHQHLPQAHQNHLHLHQSETTNALRHRVNTNTNNGTNTKNVLWHVYDTAKYVDCNVECISRTPSPAPQAAPPEASDIKDGDGYSLHISTALRDTYKPNTSLESSPAKIALNSIPTTSESMIATPMLKHNGNYFKYEEPRESTIYGAPINGTRNGNHKQVIDLMPEEISNSEGIEPENEYESVAMTDKTVKKEFRECNNKPLLTDQRLPYVNTSPANMITKELSACSMIMSSSNTSLSITKLSVTDANNLSPSVKFSLSAPNVSITSALLSTPSSCSSSSSLSLTASSSSSSSLTSELLQWQDMPQYLQFNPYVLKGYRPLTTFKGCLLSLFYWHNETINILTHAIPIVYILAIVPGLMPWESGYRFLSFCHIFGSVAPWCGSFVYHLFMNIEQGEKVYNKLLKLDMVGIWVSQSFGALPLLTASTFCFTFKWKWLIIISYSLLSFWGLYKALTASSPWQRRLCFGLPFGMRSILTFFRVMGYVGGNRVALEHVFLQDGVSILGGAIGAMRIPEKWFPGLVDFYLNSHNIMHVLVVVAVYSMYKATMKDLEWMESANCDDFVNITGTVLESSLNTKIEL